MKHQHSRKLTSHKMCCLPIVVLLFVSCQNEISSTGVSDSPIRKASVADPAIYNSMNFGMPFTEPNEILDLVSLDEENIVDYRMARYLATVELLAGANALMGKDINEPWCLTPYPKVVYNYDNTPKYYEFGYVTLYEGLVATVVTYAQKEIDGIIAYLFGSPLSQENADMDYFVGAQYPQRYYGDGYPEKYYDPEDGELIDIDFDLSETGTDEYLRYVMSTEMEQEDLNGMLEDLEEHSEDIDFEERYAQARSEYWWDVSDFFDQYSMFMYNMDEIDFIYLGDYDDYHPQRDSTLPSYYIDKLIKTLDYTTGYCNTYTLPEYSDPQLLVTRWRGYCGPSACAWVYRGKYDTYNNHHLPVFGDIPAYNNYFKNDITGLYAYYEIGSVEVKGMRKEEARDEYIRRSYLADYGLAACFYEETVPLYWKEWTFPLYHAGMNRGFAKATNDEYKVVLTCDPYEWITLNNEPVIIEVDCDHYIVAFGTGVTKKKNGRVKDKYFAIVDNGSFTKEHGYHPYMRKHNGWNLHYGLARKN